MKQLNDVLYLVFGRVRIVLYDTNEVIFIENDVNQKSDISSEILNMKVVMMKPYVTEFSSFIEIYVESVED